MINLLPPGEKNRIQKEYKLRVVVVHLIFSVIAFLIGLVLLTPSYFVTNVVLSDAKNEVLLLENSSESTEREEINSEYSLLTYYKIRFPYFCKPKSYYFVE